MYPASKIDIGQQYGLKEIVADINASEHTVGKLLQTLVKEKVIVSAKGPAHRRILYNCQTNSTTYHSYCRCH